MAVVQKVTGPGRKPNGFGSLILALRPRINQRLQLASGALVMGRIEMGARSKDELVARGSQNRDINIGS